MFGLSLLFAQLLLFDIAGILSITLSVSSVFSRNPSCVLLQCFVEGMLVCHV